MAKTTWKPHTTHGELSTKEKDDLPESVFAFPKQRKEPLTDSSHVKNALARFDQVKGVSDEDRDLAFANIKKAAKHFGIDVEEKDWRELGKKAAYEKRRKIGGRETRNWFGRMNDETKDAPTGWDYNPSEWSQRLPLVAVAMVGFGIALYLALYQWRVIPDVWEPFFGNGSRIILNSGVSRLLPIPDAALGAIGYLADAISGVIGGNNRWRTMPWIVILFGLMVGPLGLTSIVLVILQPTYFGAWCTLCLASAAISLAMIYPAMDEVLASYQFLKREKQAGKSLWRAFWGLEN